MGYLEDLEREEVRAKFSELAARARRLQSLEVAMVDKMFELTMPLAAGYLPEMESQ